MQQSDSQLGMNISDLLRLSAIPGVGGNRLRTLIGHFGSPSKVLEASPRELLRVGGIEKKLASTIAHYTGGDAFAEEQLSLLNKVEGRIVTIWDEEYPAYLKKIYDPPPFLFIRGRIERDDQYAIAVVGTRNPSSYAGVVAERFSKDLCAKGITIVSGLARGIDTIAHRSALRSDGRTIAVIGSGIDIIYPGENKGLAEQIEKNGAVVSEFFMGTNPDPGNFPRRNRIVSGMSLGTLIVETAENGGAMITASTTLDQNRELFCVPGNITEKNSVGANKLIREGHGKLVQNVDDILAELGPSLQPILKTLSPHPPVQLSVFEQRLFDLLTTSPTHVDILSERSGLSVPDTLVNLLGLEFKGMVKQLAGKMFVKT
ncbi:MAG TPA: DNA-processing protein DprA [Bacteroidota bacterium]|nr:DNA-processing protein DprA [Bacteroidota bacterium]